MITIIFEIWSLNFEIYDYLYFFMVSSEDLLSLFCIEVSLNVFPLFAIHVVTYAKHYNYCDKGNNE
jgi:hypothetical protein